MNKHPMVNDYDLSSLRNIILGAAPVSTELILDTRAKLRARGAKDLEITQVRSLLSITLLEPEHVLVGVWSH